jgi:hypothetical protein
LREKLQQHRVRATLVVSYAIWCQENTRALLLFCALTRRSADRKNPSPATRRRDPNRAPCESPRSSPTNMSATTFSCRSGPVPRAPDRDHRARGPRGARRGQRTRRPSSPISCRAVKCSPGCTRTVGAASSRVRRVATCGTRIPIVVSLCGALWRPDCNAWYNGASLSSGASVGGDQGGGFRLSRAKGHEQGKFLAHEVQAGDVADLADGILCSQHPPRRIICLSGNDPPSDADISPKRPTLKEQ